MTPEALPSRTRTGLGSRLIWWLLPSVALPLALQHELRAGAVLAYDIVLLLAWIVDARALARARLVLAREPAPRVRVGGFSHYALSLENRERSPLFVALEDDVDAEARVTPATRRGWLAAHESWELAASLRPRTRGAITVGPAQVLIESRLGLARVARALGEAQQLTVYPRGPRALSDGDARASRSLGQLARGPWRGPRSEHVEGLRAYRPGDHRHDVDVRASAKHGRAIVRSYRSEHDQPLWVVLDVSRSMLRSTDDARAMPFVELAVQAAAELCERGLSAGRRVGLCAFDVTARVALSPHTGQAHHRALLAALAQIASSTRPLDVNGLFHELSARAPRHTQIVLVTALNADVQTAELARIARLLAQKHTFSCVAIGEPAGLDTQPLRDLAALYARAAAADLAESERARWSVIERAGVPVLYFQPSDQPT